MAAFYDTNILLYSVGLHPDENAKTAAAQEMTARTDWVTSVQVLQEFFVQATRPSRPHRLPAELAANLTRSWRRQPVQNMTVDILDSAIVLHQVHRLSYWDAAIVAAAKAQNCDLLYSEDLNDGQVIDGVRIENPFLA